MPVPKSSVSLTPTIVRDSRVRAHRGESVATMAREYGVNYHTLLSAVRGRTWTHMNQQVCPVPSTYLTDPQAEYHRDRRVLTRAQVVSARESVACGLETFASMARRFRVRPAVVRDAVVGVTWADLEDPAPVTPRLANE